MSPEKSMRLLLVEDHALLAETVAGGPRADRRIDGPMFRPSLVESAAAARRVG
jgi:hypothetical protein